VAIRININIITLNKSPSNLIFLLFLIN